MKGGESLWIECVLEGRRIVNELHCTGLGIQHDGGLGLVVVLSIVLVVKVDVVLAKDLEGLWMLLTHYFDGVKGVNKNGGSSRYLVFEAMKELKTWR